MVIVHDVGNLLIVYHIYQNNIYYLYPFLSRCARLLKQD